MKPRGPILLLMTSRKFRLFALIASLPYFYLGTYYLLLERKLYYPTGVDAATSQNLYEIVPRYRVLGVDEVMRPAHRVDRHLRGEFWSTIETSSGRKWKNPPQP
jgi:hypothetical protein